MKSSDEFLPTCQRHVRYSDKILCNISEACRLLFSSSFLTFLPLIYTKQYENFRNHRPVFETHTHIHVCVYIYIYIYIYIHIHIHIHTHIQTPPHHTHTHTQSTKREQADSSCDLPALYSGMWAETLALLTNGFRQVSDFTQSTTTRWKHHCHRMETPLSLGGNSTANWWKPHCLRVQLINIVSHQMP